VGGLAHNTSPVCAVRLHLHPHVHLMVSAGRLSLDDARWVPTGDFLVSTKRLAPLFRGRALARIRAALKDAEVPLAEPLASHVDDLLDRAARKTWVIHIDAPAGRPPEGILRYLARYLFRVAIDDRRVLHHDGETVTIRTRGSDTATMTGEAFVRRFVQHALPGGFRKIRHCGLLSPGSVGGREARGWGWRCRWIGGGSRRLEDGKPVARAAGHGARASFVSIGGRRRPHGEIAARCNTRQAQ
jgi:hypothetical protein